MGVDGCRSGWLAVTRGAGGLEHSIFSDIGALASAHADAELILIDIPIGLPWDEAPIRPCEPRLKFWLGSLLWRLVSHCYFKSTGQGRHFPRAHLGAITIPDAASSDHTQARADSIMNG